MESLTAGRDAVLPSKHFATNDVLADAHGVTVEADGVFIHPWQQAPER